jgi:addiction module HigA family antidote
MKRPLHPGSIVKHECLMALRLSVTKAATALGVSRPTLSKVINGHAAVSPEMAIRLSKAFGSRPEIWLKMQLAYDLAKAQRTAGGIKVRRFKRTDREFPDCERR